MKTYISGKITGLPIKDAQEKFKMAADLVEACGGQPVNPMELVPYNPEWTWEMYMKADIKLMCDCEAIYMLDNWQESKGAQIEHDLAVNMGMKVIYHNKPISI